MTLTAIEAFRVLLAILYLFAPGILLVRPLFGPFRPRGVAGVALGLGLGLAAYGLFLWIVARLGLPPTPCIGIWGAAAALGLALHVLALRSRRRDRSPRETAGSLYAFSGTPGRVLGGILLASALLAPSLGAYQGASADSWDYMNRATSILRAGRLDAPNPYSPKLHNPYDPTFYGMIASISKLSGVEPPRVWGLFPAVATPLETGVVAVTTAILVGSSGAGAAAAVIYTFVYGPFFLFRNSGHHQMLADVPYLIALAAFFLYWRHGRRRHLALGALALVAGVTYHHFIVVQGAFAVGLTGLALFLNGRLPPGSRRRAVTFVATAAVALLPVFLFIHFAYLDKLDPKSMNRSFEEVVSPLLHFGPLYMPDPFPWYFRSFWRPLPALLLVLYMLPRLRRDPRALALSLLVGGPVLIVFNPLVFPVVAGLTGLQVATRLLNLTAYPSVMLIGWVLVEALTGRRVPAGESVAGAGDPALSRDAETPRVARGVAFAAVAASILIILPQTLIRWQSDMSPQGLRHEAANSPAAYIDALRELGRRARPGQTVLSDFVTAYAVPSFAPVGIVANFRDDFAFQTDDYPERLRALDQVLGPLTPPDSTLEALDRYDVDWILVNRRLANPLTVEKLKILEESRAGLREEFDRQGVIGYSVDRSAFPRMDPRAETLWRERILMSDSTFRAIREPGTGLTYDARLGVGAVIGPETAASGDTLYVTLYYEWRDGSRPVLLYPKLLREEAYGSRGRWFSRQIRNVILGQTDSILFPRVLASADVQARRLPPGSVFADIFELPIESNVTAGHYGLYVRPGGFPTEGAMGLRLGDVRLVAGRQKRQ